MASGSAVGGVETWLSEIVQALPEAGYEPVVALAKGLQTNNPRRYQELHPNLPCIEVNGAGLPRPSRILACLRTIKRVRPDIVLPLGLIDAVPACAFAKKTNSELRVIARTQGLLPPMLADLEDFQSVFDFAVCNGRLNARYLEHVIGFPLARIRHVPNGARWPSTPRQMREPGEPIRLVYVGRLTAGDKRAMDLVSLVREMEMINLHYCLTIAGDGPRRAALEAELNTNDHVEFRGSLSHEEVYRDIYPNADLLVSFSSSESFGISIVEAMMNGVVPISSRFLGWKSVGTIEDGKTALTFEIGDVKKAASNIAMLNVSPELLTQLSENGAAKAQKRFSWDICISTWIKIFDEIRDLPQRAARVDCSKLLRSDSGMLDKLQAPPELVDSVRRLRARFAPVVKAGGEEWPLYYRHHLQQRLNPISEICLELDDRG